MSDPNEVPPPSADERAAAALHALPPRFVKTLFASLLGGMVPGIYMTIVSAPGNKGSPVFGILLPWTILPFMLAVASAWRARFADTAGKLAVRAAIAAVLGLVAYTYFMMFHPRGIRNINAFLWLPLWQWLVMVVPMTKCAFGPVPAPKPADPEGN